MKTAEDKALSTGSRRKVQTRAPPGGGRSKNIPQPGARRFKQAKGNRTRQKEGENSTAFIHLTSLEEGEVVTRFP